MKEYKTFNQQLTILRNRGLIVPTDGKPKRFLEQENYYNVINGYKDLFLLKDTHGKPVEPETYLSNAHFNELKTLFLFDRELRFLFLKYFLPESHLLFTSSVSLIRLSRFFSNCFSSTSISFMTFFFIICIFRIQF